MSPENKAPLLTIEVTDMFSVPIIKHNGEDITTVASVLYDWQTNGIHDDGCHELFINYFEKDEKDRLVQKGIRLKRD